MVDDHVNEPVAQMFPDFSLASQTEAASLLGSSQPLLFMLQALRYRRWRKAVVEEGADSEFGGV